MRPVIWSPQAIDEMKGFLDWYRDIDERLAPKMLQEVEAEAAKLGRAIDTGRPSAIPGCRQKSIPKWSKLLIYRHRLNDVEIVSIIDTRMKPRDEV